MVLILAILSIFCQLISGEEYCIKRTQQDCPLETFLVKDEQSCFYTCKKFEDGEDTPGMISDMYDKTSCAFTYHLSPENYTIRPQCDNDGKFLARQCFGDKVVGGGRCFCHSETGERIFGWAWRKDAENMTCTCSRQMHKSNNELTLHCDEMGNYEPLQCTGGVCWCADSKSGELLQGTKLVPESMLDILPCYKLEDVGTQYLRQCESAAKAQRDLLMAYHKHGSTNVEFNRILCDYDGSYAAVQITNGKLMCSWKDGNKLGEYTAGAAYINQMNCYCARDQKYFADELLPFRLECAGNGNYLYKQAINVTHFCVNDNGIETWQSKLPLSEDECRQHVYSLAENEPYYPDSNEDQYEYY